MRKDIQSKGPVQVNYQHYRLHASVIPATFQLAQTIKNDHFSLGPCGPKYSPEFCDSILNPQPLVCRCATKPKTWQKFVSAYTSENPVRFTKKVETMPESSTEGEVYQDCRKKQWT